MTFHCPQVSFGHLGREHNPKRMSKIGQLDWEGCDKCKFYDNWLPNEKKGCYYLNPHFEIVAQIENMKEQMIEIDAFGRIICMKFSKRG